MLQPPRPRQRTQHFHPPRKPLPCNVLKIAVRSESVRHIKMRKRVRNFLQPQIAPLRNRQGPRNHLRRILEHAHHLIAVLHKELVAVELHPVRVLHGLPRLDAEHHILCIGIVLAQVVAVVGCHQRQPQIFFQSKQLRIDAMFHL